MSTVHRPPSDSLRRWHSRWLDALDQCSALAGEPEVCGVRAPAVSDWSVGQQLEHLRLADTSILDSMERLRRADEAGLDVTVGSPTLVGRFVLATGFIPRGRAKAPEATTPGEVEPGELARGLQDVRSRVESLESSLGDWESVRATSAHPILGRFTPRTWIQFCGVHHGHHGRIVRDILRAAGGRQGT